jgi:gliding motility-associated-like protein
MTAISSQTCDSTQAGLFTETFTNVYGCDSIVFEEIVLMPSWEIQVMSQTCDAQAAGTFMTLLLSSAGCDSVITETVVLLQSDTTMINALTCVQSEIGIETTHLLNMSGCDSIVILMTALNLPEICDPEVIEKNVFVPNVFSPNGDGVNDVFSIFADPAVVTKVQFLRVYNRWGAMVGTWEDFIPGDQAQSWDGSFRDKPMDPEVFVWVCQIEYYDGTTELLYGDVALVR